MALKSFPAFQKYEIEGVLGEGSMGAVYKAHHKMLGRTVALKVPHHEIISNDVSKERFLREARALAMLQHPNVVGVYDADEENGLPYIVMEYVEGTTLSHRIRQSKRLSFSETKDFATQIAKALDYIHGKGILHRDLKSSNVLITPDGQARVTDFGIAMLSAQATITNGILGTPAYMSPEQAKGETLDARSDLYSLGVIMYEALAGHPPLISDNGLALIQQIINEPPPALESHKPDVSRDLSRIIHKCLQKQPEARYSSGQQLVRALEKAKHYKKSPFRQINTPSNTPLSPDKLRNFYSTGKNAFVEKTHRLSQDKPTATVIALAGLFMLGMILLISSFGGNSEATNQVRSDSTAVESTETDSTNSPWTPW